MSRILATAILSLAFTACAPEDEFSAEDEVFADADDTGSDALFEESEEDIILPDGTRGCRVTFDARADSWGSDWSSIVITGSSKTCGLTFRDMGFGNDFMLTRANPTDSIVYTASSGCSTRRQYRLNAALTRTTGMNSEHGWYDPSSSSCTSDQTMNLGDISRFF